MDAEAAQNLPPLQRDATFEGFDPRLPVSVEPGRYLAASVASQRWGGFMTAAQLEQLGTVEADEVLRWRFEELVRAGFDPSDALALASHGEVDLHQAVDLLECGCPRETALDILL
jgi:hypothetical protein